MDYSADVSDLKVGAPEADVDHPAGYRPDAGLVDAVNVALLLNRPLLVTGEPGTGKTQLAASIAWQLARRQKLGVRSERVEKFETKSSSTARDLFYTFDVLGRFRAPATNTSENNLDYLTWNALGRAILESYPADEVREFLPASHKHQGPRRSVVLIDEVDKAPRDFPNDLLNELDEMYFRVPELGGKTVGVKDKASAAKPIVIITSNSEKMLPDPFLRRCIYYDIPFPDEDRLEKILLARLGQTQTVQLIKDAIAFLVDIRRSGAMRRKISPAELIQWTSYLLRDGARPQDRLRQVRDTALRGVGALAKDPADQVDVTNSLRSWLDKS